MPYTPPLSIFVPEDEDENISSDLIASKPNFFADSDEEMEEEPSLVKRKRDESEPIQRWATRSPARSASSLSMGVSTHDSDDDFEIEIIDSMPLKQQISPPPLKKRRLSHERLDDAIKFHIADQTSHKSTYVGEMIVPDAWATTSGQNLLENGDFVRIQCEAEEGDNKLKAKAKSKKDSGKQMTLTSMMKKKAPLPVKKSDNNLIVRFINEKGQGE